MKQELVFIPKNQRKFPWQTDKPKPSKVWTLLVENPILPIIPKHFENAFLESSLHDWSILSNTAKELFFHYYSRVTEGDVWLLLEWNE